MEKKIKISVIMSEYNTDQDALEKSINSILSQDFTDFEYIIVDDCGKNNVKKFVEHFNDDRIIVLKNKRNLGLAKSLNRAIQYARGEYLIRMDSDDISFENRFTKLVNFIERYPEYAVVGSRAIEVSDERHLGILGKTGEKKKENIVFGDTPIHPTVIMKRQVIIDVGGYPNVKRAEDFALWCELLLHGYRIYTVNDVLYLYMVNSSDYQKRSLKNRQEEIKARFYYNKKLDVGFRGHLKICKSILAGVLPTGIVKLYRSLFELNGK